MSDDVDLSGLRLLAKVALALALILAAVVIAWMADISVGLLHRPMRLP